MHRFCAVCLLVLVAFSGKAWGWGSVAHRFINRNAVINLPPSMGQLAAQQDFLGLHASDADTRKGSDPTEAPKHFIDLESYPDYRHLSPDLSSLVTMYGQSRVTDIGILPWATVWTLDSLAAQLRRGDWNKAYQSAADIGHYLGDGHQPLHCTVNYDGYSPVRNGIHSRYESEMIYEHQSLLSATRDSIHYVADPYSFVLAYLLRSNSLADSILQADIAAKASSGWSGSGTVPQAYYDALWARTGNLTLALLQESTRDLASLWYTAWVNAGLIASLPATSASVYPDRFVLDQNYPNPFNPTTVLGGMLPAAGRVRLTVVDMLGRTVAVLLDGIQPAGRYRVTFDGSSLPSGVYLYRMESAGRSASKAMILIR